MNKVTINITPCLPAPVGGFKVFYRPEGSSVDFREYPVVFYQTPIVLYIQDDPDGTNYSGVIQSDCGSGNFGNNVPWGNFTNITWRGLNGYCETQVTCAAGYTLSADGLTCTKVDTQAPITSETPIHAAASANEVYSSFGTKLFSTFASDGTGVYTTVQNSYWQNSNATLTDGPMNRNGIWVDDNGDGVLDPLTTGKQLSISFGLTVAAAGTYYIGLGGDNKIDLNINNILVVGLDNIVDSNNFRWWNIYPVVLNAGYNLITATGTGDGSVQDCIAMEIYNNTPDEIEAATQDSDLNFLFRSQTIRGGTLQIVQCASGYSPVDNGDGTFVCQRVLQTSSVVANTGRFIYAKRERLINGNPDGYNEDNTISGGAGTYIQPVENSPDC